MFKDNYFSNEFWVLFKKRERFQFQNNLPPPQPYCYVNEIAQLTFSRTWQPLDLSQNERNATLFLNHVILDFSALQISMFHDIIWGLHCVNFRLSNLKLPSANY